MKYVRFIQISQTQLLLDDSRRQGRLELKGTKWDIWPTGAQGHTWKGEESISPKHNQPTY